MSNGLKQDISIGPNLKALRKKAGLLQKEVAAQLEIMGIRKILMRWRKRADSQK